MRQRADVVDVEGPASHRWGGCLSDSVLAGRWGLHWGLTFVAAAVRTFRPGRPIGEEAADGAGNLAALGQLPLVWEAELFQSEGAACDRMA